MVATLLASALGCAGAPEPDDAPRSTATALTADGSPAPVSFHRGVAAATLESFDDFAWDRSNDGYRPTAASAHRMPDGTTVRYAGAWQRNPAITSAAVLNDLPLAQLLSSHTSNTSAGMRIVDIDVESDGNNIRFCAVWWKGDGGSPTELELNLPRSLLDSRLATASSNGRRALRISPYRTGGATRFAVVWATDGGDGAAIVERPLSEVLPAFNAQLAAGRTLTDLSPHAWGSTVTWTAVFSPVPGVRSRSYRSGMTPQEFVDEQRAKQREGLVLVDVDNWHDPAAGNAPRVSAVWHRRVANGMVSSSTANDRFRSMIQEHIDEYVALNPGARVGFLVEDLHGPGYIGYSPDLPFYLASTTKMFFGAAAMNRMYVAPDEWTTRSFTLWPSGWRGDNATGFPGFVQANINGSFVAQRWLEAMLQVSDTNATDFFVGALAAYNGAGFVDAWLAGMGLHQVGRVTSICDVDRRVFSGGNAAHCLNSVPCNVLEHYWRAGNVNWPASVVPAPADLACLNGTSFVQTDALYAPYFETYANATTPREYARFLRAVGGTTLLTQAERGPLIGAINNNTGLFDAAALARMGVGAVGTKGGTRHTVRAQVGLFWDYLPPPAAETDIDARYSFQVFVDGHTSSDPGDGNFDRLYARIVENAVRYIQAH